MAVGNPEGPDLDESDSERLLKTEAPAERPTGVTRGDPDPDDVNAVDSCDVEAAISESESEDTDTMKGAVLVLIIIVVWIDS